MLTKVCHCPANAALPDIPCVECPERFGQIQKVAFQRLRADDGSPNSFPKSGGVDTITQLANWQTAMTAADNTKIVISPYIYSPTQESGAPRTFGGGNDSLGGVEEILGREVSTFTASVRNCSQSVVSALKKMQCEGSLGVYLIDQYGNIECLVDADGNAYPIPIKSFFVGDKVHGGIDNPDTNVIQWAFVPNYSDDLHIFIIEDFNPLTDFCGGASPEPPILEKAYIKDVATFHTEIPNTATQINFLNDDSYMTYGRDVIGYLDDAHEIKVWWSATWPTVYVVTSAKKIVAPQDCTSMFEHYEQLVDVIFGNFSTEITTVMNAMFAHCWALRSNNFDVSMFDTSNVYDMTSMFQDCRTLTSIDLSTFDTSANMSTNYMLAECSQLQSANLAQFDMGSNINARLMFNLDASLTTIYSQDWNMVQNTSGMFTGCTSLVGGNGTHYNSSHTNGEYARIDRAGTPGYFTAPS